MRCKKIHQKVALSEALSTKEKAHLNQCKPCARFREDIKSLQVRHRLSTPETIKNRTLMACRQQFERPAVLNGSGKNLLNFWRSPRAAIALSVLSGIFFVILALISIYCDNNFYCRVAAGFFFILVLQNLVAALYAPLLLQHKLCQSHHY
jgi:hypothetical protein